MLYVSTENEAFTLHADVEYAGHSYETLFPSKDNDKGYLLIIDYRIYDSEGEDHTPYYEVVDLYDDMETAEEQGANILKRFKHFMPEIHPIFFNDGTEMHHFPIGEWGTRIVRILIVRAAVEDGPARVVIEA